MASQDSDKNMELFAWPSKPEYPSVGSKIGRLMGRAVEFTAVVGKRRLGMKEQTA